MAEYKDKVTFKGGPLTLVGNPQLKVGDKLPEVKLSKTLLEDVTLASYKGKKLVISVVPSLDTPVCATQTARFNKEAAALGSDVVILTVSMDLPVAQSRWCQANSVAAVVTASDYKYREFGTATGLLIKELGLLARAVYVADRDGKVVHAELVKEVASEPNYEAVLDALKKIA
jgi:thiol peroxidase